MQEQSSMNLGTSGLRDSQASPNKDIRVFLTNCVQSFLLLWFRWLQTHNFKDNREIPKWWISYGPGSSHEQNGDKY